MTSLYASGATGRRRNRRENQATAVLPGAGSVASTRAETVSTLRASMAAVPALRGVLPSVSRLVPVAAAPSTRAQVSH